MDVNSNSSVNETSQPNNQGLISATDPPFNSVEDIDWEYWGSFLNKFQSDVKDSPIQDTALLSKLQKGIPQQLRGMVWQLFSNSKENNIKFRYPDLCKMDSSYEKQIERDITRTFPSHDFFVNGLGQDALRNVIKAYSLYDPEVGYCQGIGFIAGILLLNMPEEDAFCVLVQLLCRYGLRTLYTPDMSGAHLSFFQLTKLLQKHVPSLALHFHDQGVVPSMYASQWFLTMFAYKFPLELVYRTFDLVFLEGIHAIFKVMIALLKKNEQALLNLSFESVVDFLKNEIYLIYERDCTQYIADALAIPVTEAELEEYANDFYGDSRRSSPTEPQFLNKGYESAISGLTELQEVQVKNKRLLEQQRQLQFDYDVLNQEHCNLATELVQLRVDHYKLQDEHENLEQQHMELKVILENEKGAVEKMVKVEMDQLAQKNVELATKNHALQDEVLELEKMLINLKVGYAIVENERAELRMQLDMLQRKHLRNSSSPG